jgi:hypothetical protein
MPYDTFVWEPWMDTIAASIRVAPLAAGESFSPLFEEATAQWRSLIELRVGDAATLGGGGESIALFSSIDAMKSPAIVRQFFPLLISGRSIVFQQDFSHYYTTWVHLLQWRLRDHFSVIEDVPRSSGILFKYEDTIPTELYDEVLDFGGNR